MEGERIQLRQRLLGHALAIHCHDIRGVATVSSNSTLMFCTICYDTDIMKKHEKVKKHGVKMQDIHFDCDDLLSLLLSVLHAFMQF